jgi:ankyrin repeat protein
MSCPRFYSIVLVALSLLSSPAHAGPIHEAAREGDLNEVERLLSEDPSLVNSPDEDGRSPLHWACRGVHPQVVEALVGAGAEVNAKDVNDITPLHSLGSRGNVEAAKILIESGALVDSPDYERHNALHYAAMRGHVEIAALLVESGSDLEARNTYGRTPLLLAARESGNVDIARLLLDAGADINAEDRSGQCSLELAAWRGFDEFVNLLLDRGATVPLEGRRGVWMMRFATQRGLERLFDYLVANGADLSVKSEGGGGLLHDAAAGGSAKIVRALLEKGMDVNEADVFEWTPMHHAAEMGRGDVIRTLAAAGGDVNARATDGKSPLNVAMELDRRGGIEALSALGADDSPPEFPHLEGAYMGQSPPDPGPKIFALGIVSTKHRSHSSIVFSPDGTEAYWTPMFSRPEAGYGYGTVYGTRIENGRWSPPEVAFFSKKHRADVPFFSHEGGRLYFISRRPDEPGEGPGPERIWYMEREGDGWSDPKLLDTGANNMDIHWQFTLDRDKNLYFGGSSGQDIGGGDIYVSRYVDGAYQEPENLGPNVNSEQSDFCPFIAPDGGYLIFSRIGGEGDSFQVCFRKDDGSWTEARPLWPESSGIGGICPTVSHDGKYFFYLSGCEGVEGICWVEAGRIKEVRKEVLGR